MGHQELIRELNQNAHRAQQQSVVLTFHPHPSVILRGRKDAFYLTTVNEKVELLEGLGTDIVVTHPFTYELSQSTAKDFIAYLQAHLGFHQLWVGHDFALGKGRQGNVDYLQKLGSELNYHVHIVKPVAIEGQTISSSNIRNVLLAGEVDKAAKLLGRAYHLVGAVVRGDGRGKNIGIPTANLDTGGEKLVPGAGVYACRAEILGEIWPAAVNIGTRPTFEDTDHKSHVEAHILDFSGDLYTQHLTLEFISRLRGEVRFASVEELIVQEHEDIRKTRMIISSLERVESKLSAHED